MRDTEDREVQVNDFNDWLISLPSAPNLRAETSIYTKNFVAFILLGPVGRLPLPPPRPPYVYGHLQFHGTTEVDDIFYRYEPFPTSRRIHQSTKTIDAATFAAPASEAPFTPTGFSAVARFALPSLFPARWRWELQPVAKTGIKCGASVPLYGQSGGGVEVMFVSKTQTRGAIANPTVLPAL